MTPDVRLLARTLAGDLSWIATTGWDECALGDTALEQGVGPLVWHALDRAAGRAAVLREVLEPFARAALARDLFIQRDMQETLAEIAAARVRALVIKGSALAYTHYPQPWLRPRTDTDLLIGYGDLEPAASALERRGYRRSDALTSGTLVSHQVAFEKTDAHDVHHVVDLHWKVVNPQLLAEALPFEDLWRDARPAAALGPAARVPSDIASVLIGCVHRLAHHQGHDRLIWLYDLKLLTAGLPAAGWDALTRLACDRGVASLCLDALASAHDLLGIDVPARVARQLDERSAGEPSRRYLEGTVRKRDVLVSDLKTLPGWRARLRLLREHVFPPPAFIRQRYGVRSGWLLPALYLHRLVTGAFRWVRP